MIVNLSVSMHNPVKQNKMLIQIWNNATKHSLFEENKVTHFKNLAN